MKILILGHGAHGKDTAAEAFDAIHGLSFISSSLAAAEMAVFPVLGPKYGYLSVADCYDDRRNHREEWRDLIAAYVSQDKSRLAREILEEYNCYVGMRKLDEYEASAHLFDRIFYVDAGERVEVVDPTMEIQFDQESMELIDNSGTIDDLIRAIEEMEL